MLKKKFDCVEFMRQARDEISKAMEGMTREQQIAWLRAQPITDPYLRRLMERAYAKQDKETQEKNQHTADKPANP
ncbi:MAG: hypothetical protein HUU60_10700 [Armatimonadetes bacterium]|nr:hypothetical protein [Armatimonadota bacterium]